MATEVLRKSQLSASRRHLVEVMQEANHACIENLLIRDGEPVFTDDTRTVSKFKIGGADNGPRPERALADIELKRDHIEMFGIFDQIRNGMVVALAVVAGLPRHLEVVANRHSGSR